MKKHNIFELIRTNDENQYFETLNEFDKWVDSQKNNLDLEPERLIEEIQVFQDFKKV